MSAALPTPSIALAPAPSLRDRDAQALYWDEAVASESFRELLQTKTRLVLPLLLTSFCFVIATTLLAGFAKGFMAHKVIGAFNMGYLLILATYVVCWGVAVIYVRGANASFDAQSAAAIAALPAQRPA